MTKCSWGCFAALAAVLAVGGARAVADDAATQAKDTQGAIDTKGAETRQAKDAKGVTEGKEAEEARTVEEVIESIKHPVEWLKWGADARVRLVWYDSLGFNKNAPGHEGHFDRYRGRLWATVTPIEDIDVNARVVYEPRPIYKPESSDNWRLDEGIIDRLNVVWREPAGLPVTLTLGRQAFTFADPWLIIDGTPLDGSRTTFFDAFRATIDLKKHQTTVDVAYFDQKAQSDRHISPFPDQDESLMEADTHGLIVYGVNKTFRDTRIDAYYMYTDENSNPRGDHGTFSPAKSWQANIHSFGAAFARQFDEHLNGYAALAGQLGDRNGRDLAAMGFNSRLEYALKDKINQIFRVDYEYCSGDNSPNSGTDTQFERIWSRWPLFSEILIRTYGAETRYGDVTNMHRLGSGWRCDPTDRLSFQTDYNLLFADKTPLAGSPGFGGGYFRGQLLTAWLKYKIAPRITGHLMGEAFFPGNYYDDSRNDPALWVRYQIEFVW